MATSNSFIKVNHIDTKNIKFSERKKDSIYIQYNDQDLIVKLKSRYTFGIQKSKYRGKQIALCLQSRDNPTEEQLKFVDKLEEIVQECSQHVQACYPQTKDKAKAKAKVTSPNKKGILYLKLKKHQPIKFYDYNTHDQIKQNTLDDTHCVLTVAIKIASIYIRQDDYYLQIKPLNVLVHKNTKKEDKYNDILFDSKSDSDSDSEERN